MKVAAVGPWCSEVFSNSSSTKLLFLSWHMCCVVTLVYAWWWIAFLLCSQILWT